LFNNGHGTLLRQLRTTLLSYNATIRPMNDSSLPTAVEIDVRGKTFATGLLLDLVTALGHVPSGALIGITGDTVITPDLEAWSRLTGHGIVAAAAGRDASRWVIRHGPASLAAEEARPLGSRLWLYTNFDCNLHCDYCCVRSAPTAPRRRLGLERVRRIAAEAATIDVRQLFITGGEPFLLADIGDIVAACAEVAPTVVLTNGMLFTGRRRAVLESLPRALVTLQISLDSATPELHDRHRGPGTWRRAVEGIELARAAGFRVRLAATVGTDEEEAEFRAFLDARRVPPEDRVIRRIALRGFATTGVAVGREDLVPELTITAGGVYWHPVGADDDDLLVSREIFPLAAALEQARQALAAAQTHGGRLARLFYCA
jgi:uncharacterized Fe-S cluster-containing radical SAM superfamily protein